MVEFGLGMSGQFEAHAIEIVERIVLRVPN